MLYGQDPLDVHVQAVGAVGVAGITGIALPDEWVPLRDRLADYLTTPSQALARLTGAVMSGGGHHPAACRSTERGICIATRSCRDRQRGQVAVLTRLRVLYQPVARPNYDKVAAAFDDTAKRFTAVAAVIDPEEPAEHLVHAPEKPRKAWSDAERHAHQLDEQMTALAAAASLCGVHATSQERLIPLAVIPVVITVADCGGVGTRAHGVAGGRTRQPRCCHPCSQPQRLRGVRTAQADGSQADPGRPWSPAGAVRPRGRGAARQRRQVNHHAVAWCCCFSRVGGRAGEPRVLLHEAPATAICGAHKTAGQQSVRGNCRSQRWCGRITNWKAAGQTICTTLCSRRGSSRSRRSSPPHPGRTP